MWLKGLCILVSVFMLVSCTKKQTSGTPQAVLTDYIQKSFNIKNTADKTNLIKMTVGEVKNILENLSDEEFARTFINVKKEFISLKIRDERRLSDERHSITYEITYLKHIQDSDNKVTIKKHAVFEKKDGTWLIAEVKNLKTFIEHQNELSF